MPSRDVAKAGDGPVIREITPMMLLMKNFIVARYILSAWEVRWVTGVIDEFF